MKALVTKRFRDRLNNFKIQEVGEVIEIIQERYDQLVTSPFGVFVKALEEDATKPDEDVVDVKPDLNSMTKKELMEYAKSKGLTLNDKMTKAEMTKELV